MSDLSAHLETMRERASHLDNQLDDLIGDLIEAERAAQEIGKADFDMHGELSGIDHEDLLHDLGKASRALRSAERTVEKHLSEIHECQS